MSHFGRQKEVVVKCHGSKNQGGKGAQPLRLLTGSLVPAVIIKYWKILAIYQSYVAIHVNFDLQWIYSSISTSSLEHMHGSCMILD